MQNQIQQTQNSNKVKFAQLLDDLDFEIRELLQQKNYPCIAAVKALNQQQIRIGNYQNFGEGTSWRSLRCNLKKFESEQRLSGSEYLTYWASFHGTSDFSELEFERRLWNELSCLTSIEDRIADWGDNNSDISSVNFSFSLFGEPFFVVGLHPNASRRARQFSKPTLVFNLFRQFRSLQNKGIFQSMVKAIRTRDNKFDHSANPMAVAYGEKWESIQFSGRINLPSWQCPFQFLSRSEKP